VGHPSFVWDLKPLRAPTVSLSVACDAESYDCIGYPIRGVADYIAFGGKVAGDTA
jgi:hypothetical protein